MQGMADGNGIAMEDVCEDHMQYLGGRLLSMLISAGILVGGVVVVAVEVVVVALGIVSFSGEWYLSVMEVERWRIGFGLVGHDIFDFGGDFIVVVMEEVNDLELNVGDVGRIVWCRVNEELYSLWHLSRKSLEGNMPNVGGCLFCMVMRANSLMKVFSFNGD